MAIKWRGGSGGSTVPAIQEPPPVPAPPRAGGIEVAGTMGPGETPLDFVRTARARMGMLARMSFDRQSQRALQQAAGDIAVNYLNAQKEVMVDRIVSSVQLSKRKTLEDFLRIAVEQDRNLLVLTNGAQKDMFAIVQDEVMAVLEEKKQRVDEATQRFNAGRIMKDDYDSLVDVYTQAATKLIEDKFDRMNKISASYLESFERALKKYKETAAAAESRMGGGE